MGSRRLCMAVRVGSVTFLRVLVEAPRGEWEDWRVEVLGRWEAGVLFLLCRAGRARHLVALVHSGEDVPAATARVVDVVDIVDTLVRARDMYALILRAVYESVGLDVFVSKRG